MVLFAKYLHPPLLYLSLQWSAESTAVQNPLCSELYYKIMFSGNIPPPETALQPSLLPTGASLSVPAAALPPHHPPAPWPVIAHGHQGSLLD